MVHPEAAWALGYTGQGVTIAVVDDGVQSGTHDLNGRLSSASTDVVGTRNQPFASRDQHATMVAGFAAANFDGSGTIGVAYNATILSIRTDEIGPCGPDAGAPSGSDCGFLGSDIARGIDYATTHGSKVLNMSLGGDTPSGSSTQAALGRAVAAGMVIAAAAGNADTGQPPASSPGWPARFAIDPAYNGQIIAVGALNAAGNDIASFSARAGVAQNFYILAPGENVVSGCGLPSTTTPGTTVCYQGSGTSFATPVVSGAAALLIGAFPNLSAHEVVDILLRSARDMGAPGTDAIYGRGALDIARAFSPLGALSVPNSVGEITVSDDSGPGAAGSLAFGDALSRSNALATVGYDDYRRQFRINMGSAYQRTGPRHLALAGAPRLAQGGVSVSTPDGAKFQFAALADQSAERPAGVAGLQDQAGEALLNVSASYAKGPVRFDLWSGQAGLPPAFEGAPVDGFSALAGASHAARAGYTAGRWTLSAEGGAGKRSLGDEFAMTGAVRAGEESDSHYAKLLATFKNRYVSTTVGVGQLNERGGPLGALAPAGSDLAMPATSRFATVGAEWNAAKGLSLSAEAAVGRTDAQGRLFTLRNAVSSSWRLRAVSDCSLIGAPCSRIALELSQPVRIERGLVSAYLADQPGDYFDALTFSDRSLELSPSGRELDLRVSAWRPRGPGALRLEAAAISNEGNRADSRLNFGLTAGWRARF
jgi:hypothetical protein